MTPGTALKCSSRLHSILLCLCYMARVLRHSKSFFKILLLRSMDILPGYLKKIPVIGMRNKIWFLLFTALPSVQRETRLEHENVLYQYSCP